MASNEEPQAETSETKVSSYPSSDSPDETSSRPDSKQRDGQVRTSPPPVNISRLITVSALIVEKDWKVFRVLTPRCEDDFTQGGRWGWPLPLSEVRGCRPHRVV